jgi:hypothetical protein
MASKTEAIMNLFMAPLNKLSPASALQVAIEKNDQEIIQLNQQQLDRGQDADGKSLGRYKNFKYKKQISASGPKADW